MKKNYNKELYANQYKLRRNIYMNKKYYCEKFQAHIRQATKIILLKKLNKY